MEKSLNNTHSENKGCHHCGKKNYRRNYNHNHKSSEMTIKSTIVFFAVVLVSLLVKGDHDEFNERIIEFLIGSEDVLVLSAVAKEIFKR